MNSKLRLEGMHAATASSVGWIQAGVLDASACLFCEEPAGAYKPLYLTALKRLWWCKPCETTWVA